MPEREPADQLFAVAARPGSVDPVAVGGLPTLVLRSRLWRSRSDRVDRLAIPCWSSRERVAAEVSCLGVVVGACPPTAVCPDDRGVEAAGDVVPADGLDVAVSDRGVYRKTCGRSVVADEEEPPKVDDRVHVLELLLAGGSTRLVEAVSLRRDAKRSDSDPREDQLDPDVPGEDVRGWIVSTLVPSVEEGDLAMLSVPIRLPMLGREASDG